jgi:predicted RNA-binding protein YlqC (UPF0109 family)
MDKNDFSWLCDRIRDMALCFLDDCEEGQEPFTVREIHGERLAEFHIQPKDHDTCARIIGFEGERIKTIEAFVKQVGYAWRLRLMCKCDQPKEVK